MFAVPNSNPTEAFEYQRFTVMVKLPSNAKLYFATPQTLADLGESADTFFPVEALSYIQNAMVTQGYGHTNSPYYTAPYFLMFRTGQQGIYSNFHSFNGFNVPPSLSQMLALLTYDDNLDKFIAIEYMDIKIPYQNVYSLKNMLEFYITDSNRKMVEFKDLSQLYVNITALNWYNKIVTLYFTTFFTQPLQKK